MTGVETKSALRFYHPRNSCFAIRNSLAYAFGFADG